VSLFAISVFALQGDTLRLRDGRVLTGTFQGATRNEVRFQVDGGQVDRYDVGSIDNLSFGSPGYGNSSNRSYNDQRPGNDQRSVPYNSNDRYRTGNDRYPDNTRQYSPTGGIIPAGTIIAVRMVDAVDSDSTHVGDTYHAAVDQPVIVNGQTVAPAGSDAMVQIVRVQQGGRITGREEVTLALASFQANGRTYSVNTSNEDVSSSSRGRQSGEVIGGGAALGAIIGAIAGGGEGAAIGAASGAALGTGAQVLRGQRVRVPSETRLRFTLTHDLNL